jgi:mono/diheme cytochrome c family protein
VGYIFEVISRGYGAMPSHAAQITPADRWRIAAYVRALQLSQAADYDKLPADVKDDMKKKMEEMTKGLKGDKGHGAGEKH